MEQAINFPRYKSYKDSYIKWVGMIPEYWKIQRAKWLFQRVERKVREEDDIVTAFRDGTVTLRKNRRTEGFTTALQEHGYQGIRKGDLVIHAMDAFAGAIGVSDSDGKSTPVYSACVSRGEYYVNSYYYAYLLRYMSKAGYIESLAKGIRERSTDFRYNDFAKLELPIPPCEEQDCIANFLDQKTAEIDEAIAKKHRLIDLLKEQKTILINQAVTKGLNPDVPMRDSGVDWIGDIPEHWQVKRLRLIGNTQNGISAGADYFGSGFPFVSYSDVYNNRELPEKVKGLANSSKQDRVQYSIQKGDVLFTRTSETVEEIGFSATCMKTIENSTFAGFLIRFRPHKELLIAGYSKYYFSAQLHRSYFVGEMNLVTRASLSQELLKNLPVIIPPKTEQESIFKWLEIESSKIDTIIAVQQMQIDNLKEYKVTLISNAVTGKIKI